jgi:hypothetical protein
VKRPKLQQRAWRARYPVERADPRGQEVDVQGRSQGAPERNHRLGQAYPSRTSDGKVTLKGFRFFMGRAR